MKIDHLFESKINVVNAAASWFVEIGSEKLGFESIDAHLAWFFNHHPVSAEVKHWMNTVLKNAIARGTLAEAPGYGEHDFAYMEFSSWLESMADMTADLASDLLPPDEVRDSGAGHINSSEDAYEYLVSKLPSWATKLIHDKNAVVFAPMHEFNLGLEMSVGDLADYLGSRPPKSISQLSYLDAVRLSDEWHNRGGKNVKLQAGDTKVVHSFKDGYAVLQLLTPNALDHETCQLRHCIGKGTYDKQLDDPNTAFYSLKNPKRESVATIMVRNKIATQIRSTRNSVPPKEVWEHIYKFLVLNHFTVLKSEHSNIGLHEAIAARRNRRI